MAQTTLTIYAGDQLYKYVDHPLRSDHPTLSLAATLSGSLGHSLASWFLCWFGILVSDIAIPPFFLSADLICPGNANSRGSAYGIAASVAVFLVPLMFVRLFAPQQYVQGTMLMAVCTIFVFANPLNPYHSLGYRSPRRRIFLD